MATHAAAQGTLCALRREIARIEGRLADRLEAPASPSGNQADEDWVLLRRNGVAATGASLRLGVRKVDDALGGGLPLAALTELHGARTQDAGALAGFCCGLLALLGAAATLPILWIATADALSETGLPYAPGLAGRFGIGPDALLFAEARRTAEALWIAEEAAPLPGLRAVVLELRGAHSSLDLTATRRLHLRARGAGRPLFLLRHAGHAEPTAAPTRLLVSPAASCLRETLEGPLPRSIGPPAFEIVASKSRAARPAHFTLEWNADDRAFRHPEKPAAAPFRPSPGEAADPGPALSLSSA